MAAKKTKDSVQKPGTKRVYEAPAVQEEEIFDRQVLQTCNKTDSGCGVPYIAAGS